MSSAAAVCPQCQSSLPGGFCNSGAAARCPVCDATIQIEIFPAMFKPSPAGATAEAIIEEGVSSCFYHEQKKAVVHCDGCGGFLCALCDLDFNGRHLCPTCLQSGKKKGQIQQLENRRTLYDSAALGVAAVPILFLPVTLVTAPVAICLGIVSFWKPSSVVPRTRFRSWLAIFLGVLQLAGWAVVFIKMAQEP
jgi:hypothetical protein